MANTNQNERTVRFHFIAVCGTAMASIAADLASRGYTVTGSDSNVYPPMSDYLSAQKIKITEGFNPANLPKDGLIVVGNAVSRGNPELEAALDRNLSLISLPELINRYYLTGKHSLVVAGTHGKTTTTSMIAFILDRMGRKPGWMIGGIPLDLPTPCKYAEGSEFVIEGDEYDSAWFDKRPKFLHYRPRLAIITGIEFDHGDIYPNLEAIESAFRRFTGLLPGRGRIIANGDYPIVRQVTANAPCPEITYGRNEDCDWILLPEEASSPESQSYILKRRRLQYKMKLQVLGVHNALNAVAAVAICEEVGVQAMDSIRILAEFRGVQRRLQLVANRGNIILYDDFAHHPSAISVTLKAVRNRHPGNRLWAILEPRSNTMVRNYHHRELMKALQNADRVVIGALHRKNRVPVHGRLDRQKLIEELRVSGVQGFAVDKNNEISDYAQSHVREGDVLVVMSNGSFDGIIEELKLLITSRLE